MPTVPLEPDRWSWGDAEPAPAVHLGRECVLLETVLATALGVELIDGTLDLELAVSAERGFPGVVWRLQDAESYESFFVRPHQVGNPDAIQYTPVFNGISSWQLYHGNGFWAPIAFPIGEWFRIRVVFAGSRADVYVADMDEPVLFVRELKRPARPGRIGIATGGLPIHVASFAYEAEPQPALRPDPEPLPAVEGIVPSWEVSDPFLEDATDLAADRTWTRLDAEPTGLADVSRVHGLRDGRDTVLARATIRSDRARTARMDIGFSDRATVYLNRRALYHGDDSYRSRDHRFLGSIGWWDSVYLPLAAGDNELVVAVSEALGGWGLQARFPDAEGLALS